MPCKVCGLALMDCRCLPKAMEDAGITEMIARVPYRAGGGSVPDRVLFSIKAERTPEVFSFLAEELRPAVALLLKNREILPQDALLTALPRRREAILRHGFDQAVELCRALSKESGIPYRRILLRHSFTAEEKTLSAEERVENCRRAFYTRFSSNALDGRTVLLVDDLVTTGSSLSAGAELLYRLGAKEVVAVVVGRTNDDTEYKSGRFSPFT